jgi:hypothetical protein
MDKELICVITDPNVRVILAWTDLSEPEDGSFSENNVTIEERSVYSGGR